MKNLIKLTTFVIVCSLLLFSNSEVFAQAAIEPLTDIVSLINSDTTSAGERVNTSYTLENGAVYLALGSILSDYDLTLTATGDEDADKPKIIVLADESGNTSTLFKPYGGSVNVEGIYFPGTNALGNRQSGLLESQGEEVIFRAKDCVFDSIRTTLIRMNYDESSIFVEGLSDT